MWRLSALASKREAEALRDELRLAHVAGENDSSKRYGVGRRGISSGGIAGGRGRGEDQRPAQTWRLPRILKEAEVRFASEKRRLHQGLRVAHEDAGRRNCHGAEHQGPARHAYQPVQRCSRRGGGTGKPAPDFSRCRHGYCGTTASHPAPLEGCADRAQGVRPRAQSLLEMSSPPTRATAAAQQQDLHAQEGAVSAEQSTQGGVHDVLARAIRRLDQ